MTFKLFYQKYDYITKLSTIIMNFNMFMTTTGHYCHFDYEFKILSLYVLNIYIYKYENFSALNFKTLFLL